MGKAARKLPKLPPDALEDAEQPFASGNKDE